MTMLHGPGSATRGSRRRLRLGVDLDAVVYDFVAAMRLWTHHSTGRPLASMPSALIWDFWRQWGYTKAEFLALFRAGIEAGWIFRQGPAVPGAVEALTAVAEHHDLVFITDRNQFGLGEMARAATVDWLDGQGVPPGELHLTGAKTGFDLAFHLDDSPTVAEQFRLAGERVVVYSQPWNADLAGFERLGPWADFETLVAGAEALVAA